MAQSLSNVLVHLIFSTKERRPLIDPEIAEELRPYLATVCNTLKCPAHQVGGVEDHVHIVCTLARTISVADLIEEVKTESSKWIKTKGQAYRDFAWQGGYGAFSIGQSQLATVKRYIANQREHHASKGFQDEFRLFLRRYEIRYDERYVWD